MSSTAKSKFTILPATPADAVVVLHCTQRAHANNLIDHATYPKDREHLTSPDELRAWRVRRIEKRLADKDALYFKAVPNGEPEKVAGFVGWYMPGHFSGDEGAASIMPSAFDHNTDPPPACRDDAVNRELLSHFDEWRAKIWGNGANFWYLGTLATDPNHQRQGIGTLLMQEGLRRADEDGLPSYCEATPDGTPVYPKFGYEKVGEFAMLEGRHVVTLYVRQPGKSQ